MFPLRIARPILVLLLVMISSAGLLAQGGRAVSGKIINEETGNPIVGATVAIKGSKQSTLSDEKGEFTINVASNNDVLVISYVGMLRKEIKVGTQTSIATSMQVDDKAMDEVVFVGYGYVKKPHLTGAVETINMKEIEDLPVTNIGAALAGRVLGVGVNGGIRRPGEPATLEIRNPMSLAKDGGNNQPLYVIDGVVQVTSQGAPDNSMFNTLVPAEIESISFLKDAAAALYGSRGANGVVLVTTKKGKKGEPRVSYSGSYGVIDEAYRTKMLSAYDFARYINIMNGPNGAAKTPGEMASFFSDDELEHFKTINFDWLDSAWSAAYNTNHSLSVSGGTDKATFFANASYLTQDGNLGTLKYDRWNYRAGADMKVASGFKVGLQVSGNFGKQVKTFNKVSGENDDNDYKTLLNTPRYFPMYVDGKPLRISTDNNLSQYHFYEIERLNNLSDREDKNLTFNLSAEYEIPFLKGLAARVNYSRTMGSSRTGRIGTRYWLYNFIAAGDNRHIYDEGAVLKDSTSVKNDDRLSYINLGNESYQANFTLNYSHDFGRHSISGVFSVEKGEAESSDERTLKEQPLLTTNGQFNSAFGTIDGSTAAYESGSLSYIGRANYSYANKYLAEFLFRTDASTKFAPENYWGRFFSLSAGWIISEEAFFHSSAVDFLKVRYSFGKLGKDDTRAWQWRQRYTYQNGKGAVFGGSDGTPASLGMKMEASPNRDMTWSDEYKNNLGIDARFLRNRLSTTVEMFYNKGRNMLLERTANAPISIGGTVASENFGSNDMYGIEISLGWDDRIGKDFRYGVSTRFTWYDNKQLVGNFNDDQIRFPWVPGPGESTDVGAWGYDYLGMFHTQEDINAYVSKYNITSVLGTPVTGLRPGMLYYRDVRGPMQADGTFAPADGIIDDNDQVRLSKKQSNPYGIGATFKASYKSISLDFVISGSFGGFREFDGGSRKRIQNTISRAFESKPAFWSDIYDPDLNPTGKYPNPYWEDINLGPTSQFWQVSSLSLRMRNINLSYTLPQRAIQAMRISNARFYFVALNPLILYNPYDFKDPDNAYDIYPTLRSFSLGLNLTL